MFPAFRSLKEIREAATATISGGYNKAPMFPEGKILTVKEWKKKMEYDLLVQESYKKENIRRASDTLSSGNYSSARGSSLLSSGQVS
jgi:hypothetical protein